MKASEPGSRGPVGGRRSQPGRVGDFRSNIRMEWMDPLSWRLPSGKALAEFALQAGFLAPLMLVGPRFKKPKKAGSAEVAAAGKAVEEAPGGSGTFRKTGIQDVREIK